MLVFKNVSLQFGAELLFQDFNLHVLPGSKVTVSGPSGYGKSSLLSLVPGFQAPSGGEIFVDGLRVAPPALGQVRSRLCWLPQTVTGFGSVREFLERPFHFQSNAKLKPDEAALQRFLERFALNQGILDKDLRDVSPGQKQRLGLILCFLLGRPLMLLDEPTASLDREAAELVMDAVFAEKDLTVLAVSHDSAWMSRSDVVVDLGKTLDV